MDDDFDSEDLGECANAPSEMAILRRRNAVSHILRNSDAAYWVWRILSHTGLYSSVSGPDPHAMAVASGKRDIGLIILQDIVESNPEAYSALQVRAANGEFDDN